MVDTPEYPLISDYAAHYARAKPDELAFVQPGGTWTYRQLGEEVDAFARSLVAAGVRKGDRVAIMATPRGECYLGFLAAAGIGAITVGLNPKFPIGELRYFIGDAEPKVLIGFAKDAEGGHADVLRQLDGEHACIERLVILGDAADGGTSSWRDWLAEGEAAGIDLAAARRGVGTMDAALIVYTSGSTGWPKGAVLPHRGLVYCSRVQADRWHAEPMRLICNLPTNHIGYMGDMCSYALVAGGTLYFMEKFDPPGMLELIQRERITGWGQVPTMFQITMAMTDFASYDLSSLRWVIWGGASCPREIIEALQRTGARVATSFGMTETTGSVTYTAPDDDIDVLASTVGKPDPRYEVRIARPDGTPVAPGEEGEIQVRGDHILLEYWRRPEATRETIDADGWLHTADIAQLRPDGNYVIRGRLSEMYKSGGENVYPREVELVLEEHPGVALAAVFGVKDPVYSEVGRAYVIRQPGQNPTEDELRAFCKERLANFKVPKSIIVRDMLPILPIGKVDKVALKRDDAASAG